MYYVRYFELDALLATQAEIEPYLQGLGRLNEKEMNIVHNRLEREVKKGFTKIFLDDGHKKYILVINKNVTDIEVFRSKGREKDNVVREGWHKFELTYKRTQSEGQENFVLRAKLKDVSILTAFEKLSNYLNEKYNGEIEADLTNLKMVE
ncbi:MAG: hypothetical protein Q4E55_05480 [Bacteroidales bacterium]|nr:hypothetical protein [Bacteroidales bacterium]